MHKTVSIALNFAIETNRLWVHRHRNFSNTCLDTCNHVYHNYISHWHKYSNSFKLQFIQFIYNTVQQWSYSTSNYVSWFHVTNSSFQGIMFGLSTRCHMSIIRTLLCLRSLYKEEKSRNYSRNSIQSKYEHDHLTLQMFEFPKWTPNII